VLLKIEPLLQARSDRAISKGGLMYRTCLLFVTTLLLGLSGCRASANSEGTLFVSGRIDGDTVDISARRAGRVVEIAVREGDNVEAGQLLAVISSDQDEASHAQQVARIAAGQHKVVVLQRELATYAEKIRQAQLYVEQAQTNAPAQVKEAEANLATSKAALARSEAELKQSQVDAERYAPLAKQGAVSAQVVDQYNTKLQVSEAATDASRKQVAAAEASLQSAQAQLNEPPIKEANRRTLEREVDQLKAQIAAAKSDVDADKAELDRIQANLNDLRIVAPIAGTILTRAAEPGRVVSVGQTVLTMVDLHKLYLRGFIPEGNVGQVKVGQAAVVYLDSNPKEGISAEVIRVDPQVMFTPENTYFKDDRVKQVMGVKLGLRGAYGYAKPGMPADGSIQVGSSDGR
jgi:HlyD family secretion protein